MLEDGVNSMTHIASIDCCTSPAAECTIVVVAYFFDQTPPSAAYLIVIATKVLVPGNRLVNQWRMQLAIRRIERTHHAPATLF
jgi:hypothetical protein